MKIICENSVFDLGFQSRPVPVCNPNTCICWFEDAGCEDCTDCGYVSGCVDEDD